jgi:phosphate-selective porin OprO/OprP
MERAMPNEVFVPQRNLGVSIGKPEFNERMSWAVGIFTDVEDDAVGSVESNYRITGRITGTPWYEQSDRLLHLGWSGSFVEPRGEMVRFRARPESHLAPRLVDTGAFSADGQYLMALESALVYGPFSLQGEYFRNWVDRNNFSNPNFGGYYLYGSWFVTGEHRSYKRGSGEFGRVKPKENFSLTDGGMGAWELGVRYSQVDLDDAGISGGDMGAWTGAVNWHLNPNVRLMFNYVFALVDRNGLEGDAHAFQTRFQVDF